MTTAVPETRPARIARPQARDDEETPGAACADLPTIEATQIFFPISDGGLMRRSRPWPRPDTDDEPRRHCRTCNIVADCLAGALEKDGWSFRGGMSPEERAAFGGARTKDTRKRAPYLTAPQVAARLLDAEMPIAVIAEVIAQWQEAVTSDKDLAKETGSTCAPEARITGPDSLEQLGRSFMADSNADQPRH